MNDYIGNELKNIKNKSLFPDDQNYYTFLKKVFRHEFRRNGFRRISTPVFYEKELMIKVCDDTPIHTNKCYIRKDANIGILKAYIDGEQNELIQPVYYYYMDKLFEEINDDIIESDYIGGEIIGENDPILDALLIYVNSVVFNKIGLEGQFTISINSIGIEKEKEKYKDELINFYENKKHLLTDKGRENLENNPFNLLNSSDEDEIILASEAPKILKFLKKDSKKHYEMLKKYLGILGVEFEEKPTLFPCNKYNTNTVWEFRDKNKGFLLSDGARYNDLAKQIGEIKDIPASGFKVDILKTIELLKEKGVKIKNKDKLDLYFVQLGDDAKAVVLPLSLAAREAGINTTVSLGTPSMKEQMLKAGRSGARFVVLVGMMEAKNGNFQVRDMEAGTQEEVKKEVLIDYITKKIGVDTLDFYCPARDLIIE